MNAIRIVLIAVLATLAVACTHTRSKDIHKMSGGELFEQFCASCHGPGGEGDGPVAPLIKIPVADLTRISRRHGGEFPADDVRRTIDGRADQKAHGTRDMPVWGMEFYDYFNINTDGEQRRVDAVVDQLVTYLRSIQKE